MKIDIEDPRKLAEWLQITINQRERQAKILTDQFGADSPAPVAVRAEIGKIRNVTTACLNALAQAPMKGQ